VADLAVAEISESPQGYEPPEVFQYPMAILQVFGLIGLGICLVVFGSIATRAQEVNLWGLLPQTAPEILLWLLLIPATLVVHELLHGAVYTALGYRVSYGFSAKLGAAYAAAFGQYQKRSHNLIAAATPVVVMTLVGLPLLTVPDSRVLAMSAFIVLLINTSGAVGDLYIIYRLLRMPRHTLLYDIRIDMMLIFYPQQG
jgi:predicted neutral ceramidase superfamily lipid hydrolase